MNKIFGVFLLLFLLTHKEVLKAAKFLTEKIKEIKKEEVKILNKKEKSLTAEFNSNLKIKLSSKLINNSFIDNFNNNNGRVNYNGNLKSISKFKFSKIDKARVIVDYISGMTVITEKNKRPIIDEKSKLIWKKNYYTKNEKKLRPILFFASKKNTLIVTDNITKYYALDINNGDLLWTKNNIAPFNSQIKIYKDRFFYQIY